jgi:hypothetical protein
MASSNISEPFVLATYTCSLRGVLDKALVGAYASVHQRPNNKSDEFVTVAAQADAVHILDVSLDFCKSNFSCSINQSN